MFMSPLQGSSILRQFSQAGASLDLGYGISALWASRKPFPGPKDRYIIAQVKRSAGLGETATKMSPEEDDRKYRNHEK